jgi:glucose-1-phosphate thymidylyltransferase
MARYSALIPAAGTGTRLRPITFTRPKPLVFVAGKPILGHILDHLVGVVDDITVVVGHHADKVEEYCRRAYGERFTFHFAHQHELLGLGHAVLAGRGHVPSGGLVVTLGDEIFGVPYERMLEVHASNLPCDASVGIKHVPDPRNYGVVELAADGRVLDMVEKPERPPSEHALAGVYVFERADDVFGAVDELIRRDMRTRGEFQLTDAMRQMVKDGRTLRTIPIDVWYDCGRPDMLLDVNRRLLDAAGPGSWPNHGALLEDSLLVPPVAIEGRCHLSRSVVGPHVSIGEGTHIDGSVLSDCIVGEACEVTDVVLRGSVLADRVVVRGKSHRMTVGEQTLLSMD